MNTLNSPLPRFAARSFRRSMLFLATCAGLSLAVHAGAQTTLISDPFDGPAINALVWSNGSTGSLGTSAFNNGSLTLDTNQETTARNALLSHRSDINPFNGTLTISLKGLALTGTPGSNPISLYAVVGHLPTDAGGAATAALAATYSTGGGGYGGTGNTGGALGLSILQYSSASPFQLQILDTGYVSGTGGTGNALGANRVISAMPTDVTWTINGAAGTFSVTLSGATFTTGAETGLNTISGSFTRFTAATLGSNEVSRLAIGSFNTGGSIVDGGAATFSEALVTAAIPEPSSFALLAAVVVGGLVMVRRNRRT